MAVSRIHVWISGEVLLASDLNSEFSNLIENGQDIGSPRTKLFDMNGFELVLDPDADTSITADTDDQIDIKIAGADDFQFTANTFTALSGSVIATNTINETTAASGVTIDSVLLKDGGATLKDSVTQFQDDGDATKQMRFQLSGLTTGNTRTLTIQDSDGTIALLGASQTFSGANTFSGSNTFTANQTLQSTDAGAGIAPQLILDRNSASPLAGDFLAGLFFKGRNASGGEINYGRISTDITDTTAASEDGRLRLDAVIAGNITTVLFLGAGVFTTTADDKGAETINATNGIYDAGVRLDPSGIAKGWVNFNAAGTMADSFNVTSITDTGTGDWTVNWATDFSTANYCPVVGSDVDGYAYLGTVAAGTTQILHKNNSGGATDATIVTVAAFGDQA